MGTFIVCLGWNRLCRCVAAEITLLSLLYINFPWLILASFVQGRPPPECRLYEQAPLFLYIIAFLLALLERGFLLVLICAFKWCNGVNKVGMDLRWIECTVFETVENQTVLMIFNKNWSGSISLVLNFWNLNLVELKYFDKNMWQTFLQIVEK